jgi:hypothetical protein
MRRSQRDKHLPISDGGKRNAFLILMAKMLEKRSVGKVKMR